MKLNNVVLVDGVRSAFGRGGRGSLVATRLDEAGAKVVRALMERERVFACLFDGRRYDCGSRLGLLEAQFAFASKRRELWSGLSRTLADHLHASGAHEHAAALTSDTRSTAVRAPRET